jgi:hypothetical protein
MRGWLPWLVVAVLAGLRPASAEGGPPDDLASYTVFGLEDVRLDAHVSLLGGDVGANRGTVRLGARTTVFQTAAADTIELGRGSRVGRLFCRTATGPAASPCEPFAGPVINSDRLPLVQVFPGAADVLVPARSNGVLLPAGAYGAVTVGARGHLLLDGGDYSMRSLLVRPRGSVLCLKRCRLSVERNAVLRARAALGVVEGLDPEVLRVDVEGIDTRRAFDARHHSAVAGTVYAPYGDVRLGRRGRYAGTFLGRRVLVRERARITRAAGS